MTLVLEIIKGSEHVLSPFTVNNPKSPFYKHRYEYTDFLKRNERAVRLLSPNRITINDEVIIGRTSDKTEDFPVNLIIGEGHISERQCNIRPKTGFWGKVKGWYLDDLISANGTFLKHEGENRFAINSEDEEQKNTDKRKLKVGDIIYLAIEQIILEVMEV